MVPKVAGKGRSFKGAGLYYLHDKNALTRDRVAFTRTLNLPTDDPDKAMGWMAHTALRQAEIKAAAGGTAKGRKLREPVYAYSLAWSPEQQPTEDQMIAAGVETLKVLGLDRHEAVFVAHKDEPHPHLHVIVNRVDPRTGIAAPLSNDHLKLSTWAEDYERREGRILCQQRVENNEARRRKQFVRDRESQSAAEFHRWRAARLEEEFRRRTQEKDTLARRHAEERDDIFAAARQLIATRRAALKDEYRPHWAALYKTQKAERRAFEAAQKSTFGRLRYWLRNRHLDRWSGSQADRQGMLSRAFQIVVNSDHMRRALADRHEAERKSLAERVRAETQRTVEAVHRSRDRVLAETRQRQAGERRDQRLRHGKESQEAARRIKSGADRARFEFDRKAGNDNPAAAPAPSSAPPGAAVPPQGRPDDDLARPPQEAPALSRPAWAAERLSRLFRKAVERLPSLPSADNPSGGKASEALRKAQERTEPDLSPERPPPGGKASTAFRDAQERQEPIASPEPPATGGKAAQDFRRAAEGGAAGPASGQDTPAGEDERATDAPDGIKRRFNAFSRARDTKRRGGSDGGREPGRSRRDPGDRER